MVTLLVLALSAAALRFHSLGAKTFWFDEGVSVAIARLDAYNLWRILWRREANMSLYYALLHAWLWVGNSEFFIRSLSVLFGAASIPAIYALGRRLFDAQTGFIAAALLAVNAFHVCYSQEARSYSLMVLLCILSSLYFVKTLDAPSRRNRVAYVTFSALAVYAHFYSLLLIVAQWLALRYFNFLVCWKTGRRMDEDLEDSGHLRRARPAFCRDYRCRPPPLDSTPWRQRSLELWPASLRSRRHRSASAVHLFGASRSIACFAEKRGRCAMDDSIFAGLAPISDSSRFGALDFPAALSSAIFHFLPPRAASSHGRRLRSHSLSVVAAPIAYSLPRAFTPRHFQLLQP